jgi:hypothetical protein
MKSDEKFGIQHEKRLRKLAETDRNVRLLLAEVDRLRDKLTLHRKWLDRARKEAAGALTSSPPQRQSSMLDPVNE